MTTPQTKFFDTARKVFPDNQDDYVINYLGEILYLKHSDLYLTENIIAVPFTGVFDRNSSPIYGDNIVKRAIGTYEDGVHYKIEKILSQKGTFWLENPCVLAAFALGSDDNICPDLEIIGSSLTNPELLEKNNAN